MRKLPLILEMRKSWASRDHSVKRVNIWKPRWEHGNSYHDPVTPLCIMWSVVSIESLDHILWVWNTTILGGWWKNRMRVLMIFLFGQPRPKLGLHVGTKTDCLSGSDINEAIKAYCSVLCRIGWLEAFNILKICLHLCINFGWDYFEDA